MKLEIRNSSPKKTSLFIERASKVVETWCISSRLIINHDGFLKPYKTGKLQ